MPRQRSTPVTPHRPGGEQIEFFPIHIRTFHECPERYYWRYIRKTRTPKQFSRNLEIGRATHNVLAFIWNARREGLEDPDDLFVLTERYLKESAYPAEDSGFYEEDVATVVGHASRALEALSAYRSVVSVERTLGHRIRGNEPTEVQSKIDLILCLDDGSYEHVDYKTGKRERDLVQEVIGRAVLRTHLRDTGLPDARIMTMTVFTTDGSTIQEELDRAIFTERWRDIVETIERIHIAERWPSSEGHQCTWCEFRDVVCSAHDEKRN